jgi:hypothetical protein
MTDDKVAFTDLLMKIEHKDGFLQQVLPCTAELVDDDLTTWGGSDEEKAAREAKQKAMSDKYGSPSWYDWRVTHWGTKWDVRGFEVFEVEGDTIQLQFDTAWSPPLGVFEALKEQGFTINAEYIDEGMGFVGDWRDGDDQCFSEREQLPDRLSHLWREYDEDGELI